MDPYAFAISSNIVAKDKFLDFASFRAAQTIEICSQHPGTFSIQPFCTDLFINWLLLVKCVSRRLETRLKKSLRSTFSSAIGRKSEMLCTVGGLTFGIKIYLALHHWSGIMPLFIQERKILKRNLFLLGHFL